MRKIGWDGTRVVEEETKRPKKQHGASEHGPSSPSKILLIPVIVFSISVAF